MPVIVIDYIVPKASPSLLLHSTLSTESPAASATVLALRQPSRRFAKSQAESKADSMSERYEASVNWPWAFGLTIFFYSFEGILV